MSEESGQQSRGQSRQDSNSALQGERGDTSVQDSVVSRISGLAAQEVEGIRMGGASQRASGLLGSVTGGSDGGRTRGISVEVGQTEAAVDLTLTVEYGRSAPQVADAVRRNIVSRVEELTGLRVTEVNVEVAGLFFPEEEQRQQRSEESRGQSGNASSRVS